MKLPQNKQRYFTVGLTLAAAAATAHIMQSGGGTNSATPVSAASAAAIATPVIADTASETNKVTVVAAVVEPDVAEPPKLALALDDPAPAVETGTAPAVELASLQPELALDLPTDRAEETTAITDVPVPPKDVLMPSLLPQPGEALAGRMATIAPEPLAEKPAPDTKIARSEFGLPCGPILSASAREMALVALTLTAPCRGEETVKVAHGDLVFSGRLDKLGNLATTVPALQAEADFTITFQDAETVTTYVDVPDLASLDRVAVMFDHDAGLQIHALEFGADYEEDGHVWAEAPRDPANAVTVGGGFITLLGDATLENPQMAEVYTFPAGSAKRDGVVRISVEAEVSAFNCAKDISGQTIERGPDGAPITTSLTVSMPECAAIGEFLVLKNLLQDLRIASN